MKPPKSIELDAKQMQELKERVAAGALQEGDHKILEAVITTYLFFSRLLEAKNTSIKRLRRLLFGNKTEKAEKVLDNADKKSSDSDEPPGDDTKPTGGAGGKKRKGHGRNGADAYTGAETVKIPLLLAEEMAAWLKQSIFSWIGNVKKINPGSFQEELDGKTGIVFFKDYWQRGKETFDNRSGDHIDLWNKDELTGGSMLTRTIYEFFGIVSDLNKSKEILFWEVK